MAPKKKPATIIGEKSGKKSSRPSTTDLAYSVSEHVKFLSSCKLYRRIGDYWKTHGKPFLQRTLFYERKVQQNKRSFCLGGPRKRLNLGSSRATKFPRKDDQANLSSFLRRDRLYKVVGKLKIRKLPKIDVITLDDDDDSPASSSANNDRSTEKTLIYRFVFEYKETSGAAAVEATLGQLMTKSERIDQCLLCDQRCVDTYALLQHYRCCHARWMFTIKENDDGYVFETRPTPYYDRRMETRIKREHLSKRNFKPEKKTFLGTKMLFYRPFGQRYSATGQEMMPRHLDEFKREMENPPPESRQYYDAHVRQPLLADDFDVNPENEIYPEWLQRHRDWMMDEFVDINDGEKAITKFWNLHMSKHNYIGDKQVTTACETFLATYGRRIHLENLTNNFLLHLTKLHDLGKLSESDLFQFTQQFHAMKPSDLCIK